MRKLIFPIIFILFCAIITPEVWAESITARNNYCTIDYQSTKKLKVGITYNNITTYYNYNSQAANYVLDKGEGEYTIVLYEQTYGNKYKMIERQKVNIKESNNPLEQYLISTYEIDFSYNDVIDKTATDLCSPCSTDWDKVITLKDYIDYNITYDYDLSNKIENKIITAYLPHAATTLLTGKGICYDMASLFAAMCRSQGIPCIIQKGYVNNVYHAWNEVLIDGIWYSIDVKQPVIY